MYQKINKFFRSLTVRITITIICVILPVILLIMVISDLMVQNLLEKFQDSYNSELVLYMTQLDAQLNNVNQNMEYIITENWTEMALNQDNEPDPIVKYNFWKELKKYRLQSDLVDAAYLKTKWDGNTIITHNNETVTYEKSKTLQAYINNTELADFQNLTYNLVNIDGNYYMITNENLYNYSFGFIINVNKIIDPLKKVSKFESEQIYLADLSGNILTADNPFSIVPEKRIQSIMGQDGEVLTVNSPSKLMKYMLVRTVSVDDINSTVPFLEKILRLVGFFSILIIPLLWFVIRKQVLVPLHRLSTAMQEIERDNLDYRIETAEKTTDFQHMNQTFNRMSEQIKDLTIDTYEKDIEKLQIEATNMRLQVSPHMLLNSLNMIYSLSQSKNYKCIQEFTLHLTDYFRYVLHHNSEFVTIRDEMKFVNSFLNIQKIRFPGSFVSVCNIGEDLFDEEIPPFLIQNFVENSIKYALKIGSEIEIIIIVKKRDDRLIISIVDTGNGMKQDILEALRSGDAFENKTGKHIGIWNCRRRLKMYYGDEAVLNITSVINEGTQVWIEIPLAKGVKV